MASSMLLFLLPCIAAAASPFVGGSAGTLATQSLAILTGINGSFMALNPETAGEKLYHIYKEDITPRVARLIRNNGMSALSLATTNALVARVPVYMSLDGLVPGYILQIACAVSLVTSKWIDSAVAMKIMSFFYISAGLGVSIAPKTLSKQLLQLDDATETEQRCLRAQGKTDLINGGLVWVLSIGQDFPRAMGLSCVAWIAAIVYSDFIVAPRKGAIAQLLIAGLSAGILLSDN